MNHEHCDPTICPQETRIVTLEQTSGYLEGKVAAVRAMVVGAPPDENGGLRKDVRSIADSLRDFKAENRYLKWALVALVILKTPDAIQMLAKLLAKGS